MQPGTAAFVQARESREGVTSEPHGQRQATEKERERETETEKEPGGSS